MLISQIHVQGPGSWAGNGAADPSVDLTHLTVSLRKPAINACCFAGYPGAHALVATVFSTCVEISQSQTKGSASALYGGTVSWREREGER